MVGIAAWCVSSSAAPRARCFSPAQNRPQNAKTVHNPPLRTPTPAQNTPQKGISVQRSCCPRCHFVISAALADRASTLQPALPFCRLHRSFANGNHLFFRANRLKIRQELVNLWVVMKCTYTYSIPANTLDFYRGGVISTSISTSYIYNPCVSPSGKARISVFCPSFRTI